MKTDNILLYAEFKLSIALKKLPKFGDSIEIKKQKLIWGVDLKISNTANRCLKNLCKKIDNTFDYISGYVLLNQLHLIIKYTPPSY